MIAIGVLGVGLIMVGSLFPVALSQHRDAADVAVAQQLAIRADAVLRSRAADLSGLLRVPPKNTVPPQFAGPIWPLSVNWFPVPAELLPVDFDLSDGSPANNAWLGTVDDTMGGTPTTDRLARAFRYFNRLAGFPIPNNANPYLLPPTGTNRIAINRHDMFFERPPVNDTEAVSDVSRRYMWYAFYNANQPPTFYDPNTGPGDTFNYGDPLMRPSQFIVAVCRSDSREMFAVQGFESSGVNLEPVDVRDYAWPRPDTSIFSRFPVPWRVTLFRDSDDPANKVLNASLPGGIGGVVRIDRLCPVGSKMFAVATGQMYTVQEAGKSLSVPTQPPPPPNEYYVKIREDGSTLPVRTDNPAFPFPQHAIFDVYVFPPAVQIDSATGAFLWGPKSPVIDFFMF